VSKKSSGLFGWLGGRGHAQSQSNGVIDMELLLEQLDPSQPSCLSITLKLTSPTGTFNPDNQSKCERIGRDFQAYLMGRAS
jgi:hypothetical protein